MQNGRIIIPLSRGKFFYADISDISFFKAEISICNVGLKNGKILKSIKSFKHFAQTIAELEDFFPIFKGTLINKKNAELLNWKDSTLKMRGGAVLPVAKHKRDGLNGFLGS